MNVIDYIVVAVYLFALLMFGYLLRNQSSEGDYFLGGRSMGWFPLTLSTMATQLSAISFVSAPAFVGLREGGGLKWLTYEFALPLAMILVMFVIAPALYNAGVVSIYDYLERRFGRSTRILISVSFQIVRSFATGIMVYAMGLILEAVIGIPLWQSLIVVGVITLIYSTSGGMKAVVYGDAIQMFLIFGGLLVVTGYALADIGGFSAFWRAVDVDRLVAVDFTSLGLNGDEFGFLPMLFGGFVLYASYYGCDQTQAQRIISARSLKDTRVLLFANGVLRFPLVLLYCFAGLIVGVAFFNDPELLARIPPDKPDYMMPIFIVEHLPHGVIGLLLVAIMAAAMSSLSSAVNSLAAVTMEDLSVLGLKPQSSRAEVMLARGVSIFWGIAILIMSLFAGAIAPTVIEAINKVGSALYGPILGVFLLGMLVKRVSGVGASAGLLAGMFFNLYLWKSQPQIFWMWWNFIGLVVTCGVAMLVSMFSKAEAAAPVEAGAGVDPGVSKQERMRYTVALVLIFFLIVAISTYLKDIHAWFVQ
ncbi:MAG: sodium/solute symporter [Woeseiaceae bacterium]|nr:sodium/solute symporter [Woeseiaceae bacterium]